MVPLLYIVGMEAKLAAATSTLIVTASGASGLISHFFTALEPHWNIWIINIVAVIIGNQIRCRVMAAIIVLQQYEIC